MSHLSITNRGYVLKKKNLTKKEIKEVISDLTFEPKTLPAFSKLSPPKRFCTCLESDLRLYVPKIYGINKFGQPVKDIDKGKTIDFDVKWDVLPHQMKAFEEIKNKIVNNEKAESGGILCVYCGFGKTFLAIKTAEVIGLKTLVIVNKDFLMEQWQDSIKKCSNAKVGIIQQNKVKVEGMDIVVGMLHSIAKKDYPEEIFKEFGFLVIDECHHVGSEHFSKALSKIGTKYTLGLSATPYRKDGLTQVFMNYLGPVIHKEKRLGNNNVFVKTLHIKSKNESYQTLVNEFTGTKNTAAMTTAISNFDIMNELILEVIKHLLKDKPRNVLVLGARREQLEFLNEQCQKSGFKNYKNKYVTSGLYYGRQKISKPLYKKLLETSSNCDVIWGTNDIAKEGLDIPKLNTLLLLSGGQDVEQSVGRILRKVHTEVPPTVIDFVYMCGNFSKHAKVRRDHYKSENYIIQKFDINITDKDSIKNNSIKLKDYIDSYTTDSNQIIGSNDEDNNDNNDNTKQEELTKPDECLLSDSE